MAMLRRGEYCLCGEPGLHCRDRSRVINAQCSKPCPGDSWLVCGGTSTKASIYDVQMGDCGGLYTEGNGTMYSPGFPGNNSRRTNCLWRIQIADDYDYIALEFTIFDVTSDQVHVTVSENDVDGASNSVLGRFSRSSSVSGLPIYSCSKTVSVRFESSGRGSSTAVFALLYTGQNRCGSPGEVENGNIITDSVCPYRSGDIARISCHHGYSASSIHQAVECQNGRWNGTMPKCVVSVDLETLSADTGTFEIPHPTDSRKESSVNVLPATGFIIGVAVGVTVLNVVIVVLVYHRCRRVRESDSSPKSCGKTVSEVEQAEDPIPLRNIHRDRHQYENVENIRASNAYLTEFGTRVPRRTVRFESPGDTSRFGNFHMPPTVEYLEVASSQA
ncbi:uncharacterized protein [Ptychodera flava]|uniref:uncharacterized protein n=1 Tax=Ptychodera flava TaxID=63121 RepID=UPI003969DC5F